jgi:hypothetical protein
VLAHRLRAQGVFVGGILKEVSQVQPRN